VVAAESVTKSQGISTAPQRFRAEKWLKELLSAFELSGKEELGKLGQRFIANLEKQLLEKALGGDRPDAELAAARRSLERILFAERTPDNIEGLDRTAVKKVRVEEKAGKRALLGVIPAAFSLLFKRFGIDQNNMTAPVANIVQDVLSNPKLWDLKKTWPQVAGMFLEHVGDSIAAAVATPKKKKVAALAGGDSGRSYAPGAPAVSGAAKGSRAFELMVDEKKKTAGGAKNEPKTLEKAIAPVLEKIISGGADAASIAEKISGFVAALELDQRPTKVSKLTALTDMIASSLTDRGQHPHPAVEDVLADLKSLRSLMPDLEMSPERVTFHAGRMIAAAVQHLANGSAEKLPALDHKVYVDLANLALKPLKPASKKAPATTVNTTLLPELGGNFDGIFKTAYEHSAAARSKVAESTVRTKTAPALTAAIDHAKDATDNVAFSTKVLNWLEAEGLDQGAIGRDRLLLGHLDSTIRELDAMLPGLKRTLEAKLAVRDRLSGAERADVAKDITALEGEIKTSTEEHARAHAGLEQLARQLLGRVIDFAFAPDKTNKAAAAANPGIVDTLKAAFQQAQDPKRTEPGDDPMRPVREMLQSLGQKLAPDGQLERDMDRLEQERVEKCAEILNDPSVDLVTKILLFAAKYAEYRDRESELRLASIAGIENQEREWTKAADQLASMTNAVEVERAQTGETFEQATKAYEKSLADHGPDHAETKKCEALVRSSSDELDKIDGRRIALNQQEQTLLSRKPQKEAMDVVMSRIKRARDLRDHILRVANQMSEEEKRLLERMIR
jgi:hypothetical protein